MYKDRMGETPRILLTSPTATDGQKRYYVTKAPSGNVIRCVEIQDYEIVATRIFVSEQFREKLNNGRKASDNTRKDARGKFMEALSYLVHDDMDGVKNFWKYTKPLFVLANNYIMKDVIARFEGGLERQNIGGPGGWSWEEDAIFKYDIIKAFKQIPSRNKEIKFKKSGRRLMDRLERAEREM